MHPSMASLISSVNTSPRLTCLILIPRRYLGLSQCIAMPYKPEERPPLSPHQKKLYPQVEQEFTEEGYPILNFKRPNRNSFQERRKYQPRKPRFNHPLRELEMDVKQNWSGVWPVAKTFSPSSVPLVLRQSGEKTLSKISRGKYANTELMKIANFLHLTPPAVEKQCQALLKFCNPWPDGLETDEQIRSYFPVIKITRDYVHASPTIREPRARIVDLQIRLEDLRLNPMDEDKLIRLAGHRYDANTGVLTIRAQACPSRVQNEDYAEYLLTALYFESRKHDKWEEDKPECDWERFFWEKSESKSKLNTYSKQKFANEVVEKGSGDPIVEDYRKSLEDIFANNEVEKYDAYKSSVEKLLGLSN